MSDREERLMLRYKAGFKFVESGAHAQVLDFPAAITCARDLAEARRLLGVALVDVAEAAVESGQALPVPNPEVFDPEMDIDEPIYLLLRASAGVREVPTRAIS
jgi:predicted RNase H-like HicB family nuclease